MRIKYGSDGSLIRHKIEHLLEIELACGSKFRLREEYGKLRIMTQDGFLVLEPIASNAIIVDQKDDV